MQTSLREKVAGLVGAKIVRVQRPRQGMDSEVFLCADEAGREWAVKCGAGAAQDVRALALVRASGADIPVPRMAGAFAWAGMTVLVTEKISFPLLEDVPDPEKSRYLPHMLEELQKIHTIRSAWAGALDGTDRGRTWQELLLAKYSGWHPFFPWPEIARRPGVDGELVRGCVEGMRDRLGRAALPREDYRLLHTDFNQRNLFVDPKAGRLASIIDWSEAMFGDPLYDFARVRLFIRHFELGAPALAAYQRFLHLTAKERRREELYFYGQVLDYVAWYSERTDAFNRGRLALHQALLRAWRAGAGFGR